MLSIVSCLLASCISSLEKCLLRPSNRERDDHFLIGFLFMLSHMSSLYILDSNPLSDVLFANVFFLKGEISRRGYMIFYKVEVSPGGAELSCGDKQTKLLTQQRLVTFSCIIQIIGWTEIIKVRDKTYRRLHPNTNDH